MTTHACTDYTPGGNATTVDHGADCWVLWVNAWPDHRRPWPPTSATDLDTRPSPAHAAPDSRNTPGVNVAPGADDVIGVNTDDPTG